MPEKKEDKFQVRVRRTMALSGLISNRAVSDLTCEKKKNNQKGNKLKGSGEEGGGGGIDDCNSYCQEDIPKKMVLGHHETLFGRVAEWRGRKRRRRRRRRKSRGRIAIDYA